MKTKPAALWCGEAEASALRLVFARRWAKGVCCPRCWRAERIAQVPGGRWWCGVCRKKFSVRTGLPALEGGMLPLAVVLGVAALVSAPGALVIVPAELARGFGIRPHSAADLVRRLGAVRHLSDEARILGMTGPERAALKADVRRWREAWPARFGGQTLAHSRSARLAVEVPGLAVAVRREHAAIVAGFKAWQAAGCPPLDGFAVPALITARERVSALLSAAGESPLLGLPG